MTLLATEARTEVRIDQLGGCRGSDDPGSEGQHVHVIVFNGLMCGVVIVDDSTSNPGDLVRSDRCSCARPAHNDAAFSLSCDHRSAHGSGVVGIVDRIGAVGSDIDNDVPICFEMLDEFLFEWEPGMVRPDDYTHVAFLLRARQAT